ncbi:DMT family transporter [Massilia sp. CT11-137]|uniref:DMT family transporter n=1 Tax=Massilia sp. CT11-137 TaxID=3393901 RepID=UPI0039B060F0
MMKKSDIACLTALAALWGASYPFMRVCAGEFGALTLAGARAAIAAALLLPLLAGDWSVLRRHWKPVLLVGLTNSALPFVLFALAAQGINASLSAIFNAATPLYAAVIGRAWLGEAIGRTRAAGLALGFCGVVWLVADNAGFKPGATGWAVPACVAATMLYAFSAHFSKRYFATVPPLAVAAGSQLAAALVLAPAALALHPAALPSPRAWGALLCLGALCTALAYVLFFRLIARVGAAKTMAVPFLVPAFGVLWGVLFLGETVTTAMAAGSALIVLGTALATGLVNPVRPRAAHPLPRPGARPDVN